MSTLSRYNDGNVLIISHGRVGTFYIGDASARKGTVVQWITPTGRTERCKLYVPDTTTARLLVDQIIDAWTTGRTD